MSKEWKRLSKNSNSRNKDKNDKNLNKKNNKYRRHFNWYKNVDMKDYQRYNNRKKH